MQETTYVRPPMLGATASNCEERGFEAGMHAAWEVSTAHDGVQVFPSLNPYSKDQDSFDQWERGFEAGLRVGQKAKPVRALALPN